MAQLSLNLGNGKSLLCDSLPTIYPCFAPEYACWNKTSNCWGGIVNISNGEGGPIPNQLCTLKLCPLSTFGQANFDYIPTLPGNALFAAIFAVLLIIQIVLAVRWRTWTFLIGMFGGLVLEVIGYIGRILIHNNPFAKNPFLLYLICVTIGPAFISASIYLCLGRIVIIYGESLSRLRARTYTIIFVFCDFISLLLQAVGGALASTANTKPALDRGTHIMVAGLSFQVASLLLFMCLCADFALRVKRSGGRDRAFPSLAEKRRFHFFQWALATATICIFIRCVFRVAELSKGFSGPLDNQEITYMILEGVMIILAASALTIAHPGYAFSGHWTAKDFVLGSQGAEKTDSGPDVSVLERKEPATRIAQA